MIKVSMATKKEIIKEHKKRYIKASKKEKGQILSDVCNTTGLSRDRATRLLNGSAIAKKANIKGSKRGRKTIYTYEVLTALRVIWALMDFACGKRMAAGINNFLDALERHGELNYEADIVDKLKKISPATIDRLLKKDKANNCLKGKSTTKPGTLLKQDIQIRLGNEWDENKPGFVEIDLVAHCGGTTAGEYVNTLDVTDICTGWTETRAVINKASKHVFEALMFIELQAPYDYLGIDSDNGKEFINQHLYRYCKENKICFTRSRPHRSNDNCHVEQKNWMVVRRNLGYDRFEGQNSVDLMNEYYQCLRLYSNFFLPQTKLLKKERKDAKVKKIYDNYATPYQRMLMSKHISKEVKANLTKTYLSLNPLKLKQEMSTIQDKLFDIAIPWR